MNSIPMAKLGPLTSLISSGSTPLGGSTRYLAEGPVMFVRSQNVRMNCLDLSDVVYIDSAIHEEMKRTHVCSGDVFINITGASIGRVAAFDRNGDKANVNQHVCIIRPKPDMLDFRYLTTYLCTPRFQENINRLQRGGTRQALTFDMIANFVIPLPPLPEQRRIAAILDKADAIRRKREEGIRLTEELLRSTFLEMFGDPATNPKGWETGKLGELSSIRRGSSPRPIENYMGGDVPWIKIGDATKGNSFYITETEDHVTQAGAAKSVLLEPGSLVIANSGVSLGFARILKIKGCVHDGWLSVENLDERLNKVYLLKLINCLTDHFRSIAPEGTQPNLNTGIMKEYPIPIPPIKLQRKFEQAAFATVALISNRKKAAEEAEVLFGSLVMRAFRGEL